MWWEKKTRSVVSRDLTRPAEGPATPGTETPMSESAAGSPSPTPAGPHQTFLGRTVALQGQLSGNEDLLIEGQFEGTVSLEDHCLTVGTEGQVKAEIRARQVVIHGSVTGNISARDKIEIRRTGHVVGDLLAAAIAIEEGAYFKGSIDILREEAEEASRTASAPHPLGTSA
jgi:cytoskeletal protein CcmA (bactofilin family)